MQKVVVSPSKQRSYPTIHIVMICSFIVLEIEK